MTPEEKKKKFFYDIKICNDAFTRFTKVSSIDF